MRTHRLTFALALVDLQIAGRVHHDSRAHHCGGQHRVPAMAQLAAHRSLDEVGDARREVLIALAAVDELDSAANILQRQPQVGAIERS